MAPRRLLGLDATQETVIVAFVTTNETVTKNTKKKPGIHKGAELV
jgi:hypothetical protein